MSVLVMTGGEGRGFVCTVKAGRQMAGLCGGKGKQQWRPLKATMAVCVLIRAHADVGVTVMSSIRTSARERVSWPGGPPRRRGAGCSP